MYYYPSIYDFELRKAIKVERILCEFVEWVGKKSVRIKILGYYKNKKNPTIVVRKHNCKELPVESKKN